MRYNTLYLLAFAMLFCCIQCSNSPKITTIPEVAAVEAGAKPAVANSKATFAGGCFWCEEAVFESVKGVADVVSGYAGGHTKNPSYEEVGSGQTGHAESVEVAYDSTLVSYGDLLRVYFASIDPTQVNGQGPDHGTAYRSIIFYRNSQEKQLAEKMIAEGNQSSQYDRPIAVQMMPFEVFWPAEGYHQDYVRHNPGNPYVQHESLPRLRRTQSRVPELILSGKKI